MKANITDLNGTSKGDTLTVKLESGVDAKLSKNLLQSMDIKLLGNVTAVKDAAEVTVVCHMKDGKTFTGRPWDFNAIVVLLGEPFDRLRDLFPAGADYSPTSVFDITSPAANELKSLFRGYDDPGSQLRRFYQPRLLPPNRDGLVLVVPVIQITNATFGN